MANKVVSQLQEEENEVEKLRKAYEDAKKELANKKRAYTKLVNQTEDMKKELENLYESLDKGPYKKTARFDSTVYDRIAELEEAIRVNDEKLGREKIEDEPVRTQGKGKDDIGLLLTEDAKKELSMKLSYVGILDESIIDGENILAEPEENKEVASTHYAIRLMNQNLAKSRELVLKELSEKNPEISKLINEDKIENANELLSKLGLEPINLFDLDNQEDKDNSLSYIKEITKEANSELQNEWADKKSKQLADNHFYKFLPIRDEAIGKIKEAVHQETQYRFQSIGLNPILYLDSEEEINKTKITLSEEQKAVSRTLLNNTKIYDELEKIEKPNYEKVEKEFIRLVDIEKDTLNNQTYSKIAETKEKMDLVIKDIGKYDNLRTKFKQKREERKLAHELGIKRKDLRLYQQEVDDMYDQFNGVGLYEGEDTRVIDLNKLVIINNILDISDEEIETIDTLYEVSKEAHKLVAYDEYVDSIVTEDHIEDSREVLKDFNIISVNSTDWSKIDTSKLTEEELDNLEENGLEVHNVLEEIYDDYDSKVAANALERYKIQRKYDKIEDDCNETMNDIIDIFVEKITKENALEETEEQEDESDDELNL